MKTIRILIAEDNDKIAFAVKKLLETIFSDSGPEKEITCDFVRASNIKDAKDRIDHENLDLIYLDGSLANNKSTLPLIPRIEKCNPGATVFLLTPNNFYLQKAKRNLDPEMCFTKHIENLDQIISKDDLEIIKKKFLTKNT